MSDSKYDVASIGERVDQFLHTVLGDAGFRLEFDLRDVVSAEDDFETPEVLVKFSGPDVDLLLANKAELLLARSYEADGKREAAAAHYQKVYVEYPLSGEASDAQAALVHYPVPDTLSLLSRGLKLVDHGDYDRARKELTALLPLLNGAHLDLARVRIGAARHLAREDKAAYEYLSSFHASSPELEAERLFYLLDCARRLDRSDEVRSILDRISGAYPQSIWRFNALLSVANYYTVRSQSDAAEPLYRVCYEAFPNEARSAQCNWRIAWIQYLRDPSSAVALFEEHLKRYPDAEGASTALYFLGRIAESKSDLGTARVYY